MGSELDDNRKNWDDRVDIHFASAEYDVEGFVRGGSSLPRVDLDMLGDVRGKSLVQLQCHFGMDALSWARLGADVTGLDFSPRAIARANELRDRCALQGRFVEGDVHDAVRLLGRRFDVVYVSVGALCWLPSIARWADIVRDLLAPRGTLYVRDVHPILWAMESPAPERFDLVGSYFETPEPFTHTDTTTYAGTGTVAHGTTHEWNHGLGEIVQALIDRGLVLERLEEHRSAPWAPFPWMVRGDDRLWRLPAPWCDRLPLCFSLRARAP